MKDWQLTQMQGLPLEAKVIKSQLRIREWYDHFGGNVYVSFSGGKDSTVLLHLVRDMYPEVPAVFADTGLEFPEIRAFVKSTENVTWLRPELTFRQVIEKHGYPVISKEQSEWIHRIRLGDEKVRTAKLYGVMSDGRPTRFTLSEQWRYMLNAPFKIGSGCCNEMKKKPLKHYVQETGRAPMIGTMAAESKLRRQQWLKTGCNAFDAKRPISTPIAFWTEADIWAYIKTRNVPYSPIYDMGYERTGCVFCMFGAHLDDLPNRFQRLQQTHPVLWRYCMKAWDAGGLGLRSVLDFIGIPAESFTLGDYNANTNRLNIEVEPGSLQSEENPQAGRQGV